MNFGKKIAGLSALACFVALPVIAQSTEQAVTPAPGQPEPFAATRKATADAQRRVADANLRILETLKPATIDGQPVTSGRGVGGPFSYATAPASETPVLLVTAPMDDTTRAEWKEDQTIMYKLVRDSVERGDGKNDWAMGIRLRSTGTAAPIYVEDCGVIFRVGINLPLASSGNSSTTKPGEPATRASAWELTKRELNNPEDPAMRRVWGDFSANRGGGAVFAATAQPPAYDKAKIDALIDGLIETLPEASHFRHLKPTEFVFVTISGTDDAGTPKRLTLKAKKSDIDDAASGKIKSDEFKRRVARSIG